jgi:hypothetical protein
MSYIDTIRSIKNDPEQLELTYQAARKAGQEDDFRQAVEACYADAPENLLYAAWHHRLAHEQPKPSGSTIAWSWVVPLAVLNGLLFWWLSDPDFMLRVINPYTGEGRGFIPLLIPLAAPIAAVFVLAYLAVAGARRWGRAVGVSVGLAAATAYAVWIYPFTGTQPFQEQYLTLMAMHLPLLAWAGVGVFLLIDQRDPAHRFAFLIKSLEVFIMGGLFMTAGGLFTGITFGLFAALGIEPSELVQRLFFAGGGGLIPVLAVAVLYNPAAPPGEQSFEEGLSKLVALLMRVLLPLTLLVLVVYLGFIPFNFRQPFENRDVLIIYNGMLFAVMALLVGATPAPRAQLPGRVQSWLRRGIVAVTALALIVSLYALAAIVYRTAMDRPTPNRLTFIGWNLVNIGVLVLLLVGQARTKASKSRRKSSDSLYSRDSSRMSTAATTPDGTRDWVQALHRTFSMGALAYIAWTLAVILVLPWVFRADHAAVQGLPFNVQNLVYERNQPILLKCSASPHIYLLENGQKRWIKDIPTFNARGYKWSDVNFVSCTDLRNIPAGTPIPANAGPPPEP